MALDWTKSLLAIIWVYALIVCIPTLIECDVYDVGGDTYRGVESYDGATRHTVVRRVQHNGADDTRADNVSSRACAQWYRSGKHRGVRQ